MAISAGTYVIVSAGNTNLAVDSDSRNDNRGTNVTLWDRNDGDSQLVRLVKSIYNSNHWIIQFVLSGMCLDRYDNGSTEGTNVIRWDWADDDAIRWRIIADGKTVSINGTSYPTYFVKHKTLDLDMDVYQNVIQSGQNIAMYNHNGGDNQRWAFIPQNPIPNGTYEIRPAISNDLRVDVANNSSAWGAKVQVYTKNDTNAQKWKVVNSGGLSKILNANTGLALDAENWGTSNGTKIVTWKSLDQDNQKWLIEPSTDQGERNDQPSALYRIHHKNGTGKVLDVSNNGVLGSSMQLHSIESTSNFQLFQFVPTEYLASNLPVPSGVDLSYGTKANSYHNTFVGNAVGTTKMYVHWVGGDNNFQVRWRSRARVSSESDASVRGVWSSWHSLEDGSTSNGGWGPIQKANISSSKGNLTSVNNQRFAGPLSFTLYSDGVDLIEVETQVRCFSSSWGSTGAAAHGNSATGKTTIVTRPTVSGVSATITPDGLAITYTSSFKRNNNTINVECAKLWKGRIKFTGQPYSGTVVIPFRRLREVPEDGDTYSVTVRVTTCDNAWDYEQAHSVKFSYDSNHGTSVGASSTMTDGGIRLITVDGTASAYLIDERGHGNRFVELATNSDGKFVCPAPLNKKYRVLVVKGTVSGSSAWATKVYTYNPIETRRYYLTSLDGAKWFALVVNSGDAPAFSVSYERDMTLTTTTGREREIAGLGETTKASWSLTGVLVEGLTDEGSTYTIQEQDEAFDVAAHIGYCYFRAPNGFWAPCVVKSSSIDYQNHQVHTVSFSFEEVEV